MTHPHVQLAQWIQQAFKPVEYYTTLPDYAKRDVEMTTRIYERHTDMVSVQDTLRTEAAKMLQRAAEAEAEAKRQEDLLRWEPPVSDDPENCPVIYWNHQFMEAPARIEHFSYARDQWMPCQQSDIETANERCTAREHREAPPRMSKMYSYVAIRSINGLWYSSKLHNGSGTTWAKLVENFPTLGRGEFWVASEYIRPIYRKA